MSIRVLSKFLTLSIFLVSVSAFAEAGRDAGGGNCGRHNQNCLSANIEEGGVHRGVRVQKGTDPDNAELAGNADAASDASVRAEAY